MFKIKRAKDAAISELRKTRDKLMSVLCEADDCVNRVDLRSHDLTTQPLIHPRRRIGDRRRRV